MQDSETAKTDVLLLRIKHQLVKSGDRGMSMRTMRNRLGYPDVDKVMVRLDYLLNKGYVRIRDTSRVYNGLPVVMYQWVS